MQQAIDNIMKTSSITTIIIAHRLSTVKDSDKIAVLNKGKIQEIGNHDELMKLNGAYKRLINAQNVSGTVQNGSSSQDREDKQTEEKRELGKSEDKDDGEKTEEDENMPNNAVFSRAFKYNKSEGLYIFIGLVGAAMAGSAWPVSAIVLSKMTTRLNEAAQASDIRFFALMFFAIGCVALVGNILQMGCLGISGNKLTRKIRQEAFRKILSQDMKFFDKFGNDVGSLTSRLASECTLVRGLTGDTLGTLFVAVSTLGCGITIALVACWRIALVILALVPGIALAGVSNLFTLISNNF